MQVVTVEREIYDFFCSRLASPFGFSVDSDTLSSLSMAVFLGGREGGGGGGGVAMTTKTIISWEREREDQKGTEVPPTPSPCG